MTAPAKQIRSHPFPRVPGCSAKLGCLLGGLAAFAFLPAAGRAQDKPLGAAARKLTLADVVPANAEVFIEVRDPAGLDRMLGGTQVGGMLGVALEDRETDRADDPLLGALRRFAGAESEGRSDWLKGCRVGLVARSLGDLNRATWLVQLDSAKRLDEWFPEARRSAGRQVGEGLLFRTRDGLYVCERDGIVALARRQSDGLMVRSVQKLMVLGGSRSRALADEPAFRELEAGLPRDQDVVVYVKGGAAGRPGVPPSRVSPLLSQFERALIGVNIGPEQLSLAVRARLGEQRGLAEQPISAGTIERLLALPQTTVLGAATTIDFRRAFAPPGAAGQSNSPWNFVDSIAPQPSAQSPVLGRLGPDAIVVLGQDLEGTGAAPQLAVMIRCSDARLVRQEFTRLARNLIGLVQALDPVEADAAPTFKLATYLGSPIVHVPLKAYAEQSRLQSAPLLTELDPAWTSWRDWFILALTREHVERILDGQMGLIPTMRSVPGQETVIWSATPHRMAAVAQPAALSDVLGGWLSEPSGGVAAGLKALWGSAFVEEGVASAVLFGAPLTVESETRMLVIREVSNEDLAAAGVQSGDRILGVDGHLLDLERPRVDFMARLAASKREDGPVLRILREQQMIEVAVPRSALRDYEGNPETDPLQLLRLVKRASSSVEVATLGVRLTEPGELDGTLSLRLSRSPARAAAGEPASTR